MMKMFFFLISLNLMTLFLKKKISPLYIPNFITCLTLFIITLNNFKNLYWMKINYVMGMDLISLNLILLNFWIMYVSMYSNNTYISSNTHNMKFLNILIIMMNLIFLCFSSLNMILFYIFFEASLIPIMFIIMGWGYQIDRIQASMYMIFYTLIGSLPLLILMMYMYMYFNTLMFNIIMMNFNNNMLNNMMMYTSLITAFLIKMPMYMMHLWLPKAHVEAPISGSMILAGVMLKLGSYGLYRMMYIFQYMSMSYNYFIIILSLIGSLMSSLICMNQNDLKIIVAYSSIVHMGTLLASLMTLTFTSMTGSLMMMIAHGLCSPMMFWLVNINYERLKSRTLMINKGMINLLPSLTLWWFLSCSSNFSAPPSLNLVSEILLLNSLILWSHFNIILIIMISFFSTSYSILIFAYSQYGKPKSSSLTFNMINYREYLINLLLWLPLNLVFLNLNMFY